MWCDVIAIWAKRGQTDGDDIWGVVEITSPDLLSSCRNGSSQRVSCREIRREPRGGFLREGRRADSGGSSRHITSRHFMPGKYSIVSGGRKWVPGCATMIGARGHARATFSHFLTRQLHHFLSGYCTYVMQHSRRLSPRAEPFHHVWWCQRVVWYLHTFFKRRVIVHDRSSASPGRCPSKIPAGSF